MIAFTQCWKVDLQKWLAEVRITVRGHRMRFNFEATRWLGIYQETVLQFRVYKNISFEKAKHAEERVRRLGLTDGLELRLIRRVQVPPVQVATVQAVALYRVEI